MSTHFRNMLPVPIDEFIRDDLVGADLYVRLSTEKFVMIAKAGQKIEGTRVENYKRRNVAYLFIRRQDWDEFAKRRIHIADIPIEPDEYSNAVRELAIIQKAKPVFDHIQSMTVDSVIFEDAKHVSEMAIGLVHAKKSLTDLINALAKTQDSLLAHSLAVSVVSVMIGQALSWTSRAVLEKLALGGLLHDIGKANLSSDFWTKPKEHYSHDEKVIYESHAEMGAQVLHSLKFVPDDVVAIVHQHHERADGTGFPGRYRDPKTHPLARVVSLANAFCEMTMDHANPRRNLNPTEAIAKIEVYMQIPFNKDAFEALRRVIQTDKDPKTEAAS